MNLEEMQTGHAQKQDTNLLAVAEDTPAVQNINFFYFILLHREFTFFTCCRESREI
jgi:hypothetical protein